MRFLKGTIIVLAIAIIILIIIIGKLPKKEEIDLPKEVEIVKPEEVTEIAPNNYNNYHYTIIPEDRKVVYILGDYLDQILYEAESAYESLDEYYKKEKFTDLNDFKKYVETKKEEYKRASVYEYSIEEYEDYTQYVIIDQFDNKYLFKENGVLNYTAMLDLYTIDTPQFEEKYDSCNAQEKVILNIDKIKQAFNEKDYSYVYRKLAQSFKNNKYKTEEDFENYIKTALYDNIEIEYKDFLNEGETYIYNLVIKNAQNKQDKGIDMQIIMQLKDNRDFVMSFNIK